MERVGRDLQSGAGQKIGMFKDRSPRRGRSALPIGVIAFAMSLALPSFASSVVALGIDSHWILYFEKPNGDRHFFHEKSLNTGPDVIQVWNRIQFNTSVMGAYSYQNYVEIDCVGGQERILEVTFFSDRNWSRPAMATDTQEKPPQRIQPSDPIASLFKILCGVTLGVAREGSS
jgi:hypothetical protein